MEDIFTKIGEYLDDSTLEKLYLLGMDMNLRIASKSQHWWYERILVLSQARIQFSNEHSWKQAYILLKRCLFNPIRKMTNVFFSREDDNPLIIDILLGMRLPGLRTIVHTCIKVGLPKMLQAALDSDNERIYVTQNDLAPFIRAIDLEDRTEEFRILLSHPRATNCPDSFGSLLCSSIKRGREDITKILLEDKRIDSSRHNNLALCDAIELKRVDIVRALLRDGRMNLSILPIDICSVLIQGNTIEEVSNWMRQVPELMCLAPVLRDILNQINNVT